MYSSEHSGFIVKPLAEILKDGLSASKGVGDSMEGYPIADYLMESLFIRMTGAMEQKLKCICWDMATLDYDYRYDFLNKKNYGECSDYRSKNGIYNDIIDAIQKYNPSFKPLDVFAVKSLESVIADINVIFANSNMRDWKDKEYQFYLKNYQGVLKLNQFCQEKQSGSKVYSLLQSTLKDYYELIVYKHRNRCAHNTLSYQSNKPDLDELADPNCDYQNYFFRFSIILVIDFIFSLLYKKLVGFIPERY